ncbi:pyridoxal phosphate-dependent aminotransferase [Janibacter alkaliphilus]|uniref:N-succinyldiaminopimelate aminotransferase n=1 Tax=Janibacter alkaliphilus TaxID=1069963 RepID=A0A852X535_9MICO|nr:aminotransferase class I/II-fold pyridoxal phosphate-dependent enzyme [Janibacter alkaliphilus]NYG37538.1 N-succinyldiaminopimelate aminotransferase [Janibacter alkaliphilus]
MTSSLVPRMQAHGESIFVTMARLAIEHGALNLGQGFPDDPAPEAVAEAARRAIAQGHNQYPPARGIPELRRAIAQHQGRYGLELDPDRHVMVTAGATGALAASVLALVEPGDEVVVIEPYYDAYPALVDLAGGVRRTVPLRQPDLALDVEALRASVGPRTRLLLLNTPNNPMGKVYSRAELAAIAEVAIAHDVVVVSDEVYEHMTFDGHEHTPVAALPGMWERTITISSAGKTFSVTGWKVGWATGPDELVEAVAHVAQWLTFTGGAPFQPALAEALDRVDELVAPMMDSLRHRRGLLLDGLTGAGLVPRTPEGSYFVVADAAPLGVADAHEWCLRLPQERGVAAVPVSAFCDAPEAVATLARFAFCKSEESIREGCRRLAG